MKSHDTSSFHHERKPLSPRHTSSLLQDNEDDPLSVVVNLFDVAMVFAVALMVAMVMHLNMTEFFGSEEMTIVKNPGKENMEIITKEGREIKRYTPATDQSPTDSKSKGRRIGIAYELENGEVIYVPE